MDAFKPSPYNRKNAIVLIRLVYFLYWAFTPKYYPEYLVCNFHQGPRGLRLLFVLIKLKFTEQQNTP